MLCNQIALLKAETLYVKTHEEKLIIFSLAKSSKRPLHERAAETELLLIPQKLYKNKST